jgi:hypothetical protein
MSLMTVGRASLILKLTKISLYLTEVSTGNNTCFCYGTCFFFFQDTMTHVYALEKINREESPPIKFLGPISLYIRLKVGQRGAL